MTFKTKRIVIKYLRFVLVSISWLLLVRIPRLLLWHAIAPLKMCHQLTASPLLLLLLLLWHSSHSHSTALHSHPSLHNSTLTLHSHPGAPGHTGHHTRSSTPTHARAQHTRARAHSAHPHPALHRIGTLCRNS